MLEKGSAIIYVKKTIENKKVEKIHENFIKQ